MVCPCSLRKFVRMIPNQRNSHLRVPRHLWLTGMVVADTIINGINTPKIKYSVKFYHGTASHCDNILNVNRARMCVLKNRWYSVIYSKKSEEENYLIFTNKRKTRCRLRRVIIIGLYCVFLPYNNINIIYNFFLLFFVSLVIVIVNFN